MSVKGFISFKKKGLIDSWNDAMMEYVSKSKSLRVTEAGFVVWENFVEDSW
jgi:hypothetical protein